MAGAYLGWVLHGRARARPVPLDPARRGGRRSCSAWCMYRVLVRHLPRGAAGGPASLLLLFGVWLVLRNAAYLLFTGNDQAIRTAYSTRALAAPRLVRLGEPARGARDRGRHAGAAPPPPHAHLPRQARSARWRRTRTAARWSASTSSASTPSPSASARRSPALAGLLSATLFSFNPAFGSGELLKSFVVVVLGGLGSVFGTGVAALILAVVEVFAILVLPSYLTAAVGFVMLVLVLVLPPGRPLRPAGARMTPRPPALVPRAAAVAASPPRSSCSRRCRSCSGPSRLQRTISSPSPSSWCPARWPGTGWAATSGQVSFGHAAMFGLGGFVAARLMLLEPAPPAPLAWLAGGLAAGIFALGAHPTLRLRGPYFSIATIGLGEAARLVFTYWEDFTGGASGLSLPIEADTQVRALLVGPRADGAGRRRLVRHAALDARPAAPRHQGRRGGGRRRRRERRRSTRTSSSRSRARWSG